MNRWIGKTDLQPLPRRSRLLGLIALVGSVLVNAPSPSMAEMVVYTVNYPLAYFAERIGGDSATVRFPAPSETDPAFWKPDPEIIAAYQSADLILLNGAGYAAWIGQASLPRRKLVDTSRSFRNAYLPGEKTLVHQHGPAGEHAHGKVAFTTWLDPEQAIAQARAIESAFAKRLPDEALGYSERADALVKDLETLDCELVTTLGAFSGEPLLASHPVFPYLARRYGLDLRSVAWEPDLDPGEAGWEALDALLGEKPARWMLWEAPPVETIRQKLKSRGVGVIVFAIASSRPAQGDYLSVMNANADAVRHAAGQDSALQSPCVSPMRPEFR
jgi:zinc transport system substrate-binding protein